MQAIQFPPNPTLNQATPAAPANQRAPQASPIPQAAQGLFRPRRPDCSALSLCCAVPLIVMGGVASGMATSRFESSTNRALYAFAAASLFTTGITAIAIPFINQVRAERQPAPVAEQLPPSPRYQLPPLNPANHVVVELPDLSLAVGIQTNTTGVNQS